jgi:Zn-dependent oligopeptidase
MEILISLKSFPSEFKFQVLTEFHNFCWDNKSILKNIYIFQVVRTFARHYETQQCMPEDMLVRLCASKHLFAASDMQVQVFYSALDQQYHSSHPLEGSTTDVLAQLQKQYYGIPYVPNTVSLYLTVFAICKEG